MSAMWAAIAASELGGECLLWADNSSSDVVRLARSESKGSKRVRTKNVPPDSFEYLSSVSACLVSGDLLF